MIRDRVVCGIDAAIQKRLLAEPKLTYAKAVEIAQSIETAAQSMRELRVKPEGAAQQISDVPLNRVDETSHESGINCYCCGNPGHMVAKCKMSRNIVCHKCGKTRHIQKVCKSKKRGKTEHKTGRSKRKPDTMRKVESSEESDLESSDSGVRQVCTTHGATSSPPITVLVEVDGCSLGMDVDTGASHILM